jgi:hypothetical protein
VFPGFEFFTFALRLTIMEFVVKCVEIHTVYVELKETFSTIFKYFSTAAIAALLAAPKRTI